MRRLFGLVLIALWGCGSPASSGLTVSLDEARKLLAEAGDTLDSASLEKAEAGFEATLKGKADPVVLHELGTTQLALVNAMAFRENNPKKALAYADKAIENLDKASQALTSDNDKAFAFARLSMAYGLKIALASGAQQADWGLKYGRLAKLASDQAIEADGKNVLGYVAEAMMRMNMPKENGGDPKKAVETLKRAEGISPNADAVQAWLGMAYTKAGMKAEAKAAYEKAISLNPKNEFAKAQLKQPE